MPRTRDCDFCGDAIEPGTGTMFVRTDGTTIHYCSAKCEKNADLGRESRDLEWTDDETPGAAAESEAEDESEDESQAEEPEPDTEPADEEASDEESADDESADDESADVETVEDDEEETEAEA